jgi:hypothetical protein
MPTLPTPGGDLDTWGVELNEWLAKGGITHNVKHGYGAAGDGTTDDTAAIQAAIDAVTVAGSGIVYLPEGTYKLVDTTTRSGVSWHLSVPSDNITITGPGTLTTSEATTHALWVGGWIKAGSSWDATAYADYGYGQPTFYNMTAAAQGDVSVTLTTVAQAANFAVGDRVFIRSGQTLSARITEPDAEINEVVSANAGTGVIVLKYPLTKAYAQEYFVSGTTGVTTTAVTANPATYGIGKVTDRTSVNVTLEGFAIEMANTWHAITGSGVDGLVIRNMRVTGGPMMSMGNYRGAIIADNTNSYHGSNSYGITAATGTTDTIIENNELSNSQAVNQIHLHEGSARIMVRSNKLVNAGSGADFNAISVRARAYNVRIEGNEIVGAGSGVAILVDESCDGGGVVRDNQVAAGSGDAIGVAGAGWHIYDNIAVDKPGSTYYPTPMATGMQSMSGWVKYDAQTLTLGTLPPYSLVTKVIIIVQDYAFNSDGTDLISVGYDGGGEAYYAAATAVSTAFTRADPAPATQATHNYTALPKTVKAYYTNGGTEPTQGEAFVFVEWCRVGRN